MSLTYTDIFCGAGGTWNTTPTPVDEPMRTRTTRDIEAIACPPIAVTVSHAGHDGRSYPIDQAPLAPKTTSRDEALVTHPFVAVLRNNQTAAGVDEPLTTISAGGRHHGLTVPPGAFYVKHFTPRGQWGVMSKDVATEPLGSITRSDHHSLVIPYRRGRAKTTAEPLHTLATRESAALVAPSIDINDCYFRMLKPREHLSAQRFPLSYVVKENQGEQTMQAGNAVVGQRAALARSHHCPATRLIPFRKEVM